MEPPEPEAQVNNDKEVFLRAADSAAQRTGLAIACTGYHRYSSALAAGRYVLPNGLTILLMPDERAGVFAFQTWFRVGSKHENPQKTGMAHLCEHMMFKGTRAHAPGAFDREMELRGSQTNAATWVDWTYYMQTLAARGDNLEVVAEFEADRMAHLVFEEDTFRSELDVVRNERRMSVDDSVVGELSEILYATAYARHPYRWPTIGLMEHLDAVTVADLEAFYSSFYSPSNATVVVAGAIDLPLTLSLLARTHGSLAARELSIESREVEPVQQEARLEIVERPVVAPQILIGYHAPSQLDPSYAAVELIGEILVVGDNSRLYHRLVTEEKLATDVVGYLTPFAEPGLYEIHVSARPEAEPERVLDAVQDELDRLQEGIPRSELNKARNGMELSLLDGLKDPDGCAEALGHYETNFGDFSLAFRASERWSSWREAELREEAAEVFRAGNRTAVIALPRGD